MRPRRWIDGVLLALAIGLGGAARILPLRDLVLSGPGALLLSTDPYYHVRRIQHAVRHFPDVPGFDAFVNFPEGARIIWPKGFDLLLAGAARLALPDASPESVERFCALAIPVLGLLAIAAIWAFARASLPPPAAGVAAMAFAFLQMPLDYSLVGYVDHHVLEPVFLALSGALLLAGLARRGRAAAILGAAAGILAALSCAFVTVGMAIAILLGAIATWEALRGVLPGARPAGLAAVAAGALALLPLCAATPWGERGAYTHLAPSLLHAHLALAGAALAFALVLGADRSLPPRRRAVCLVLGLVTAAATMAHGGEALVAPMRDALRFVTRRETLASTVTESEPLWRQGWNGALLALTPLGFLAPAILVLAALRDRGRPAGAAALLSITVFALGCLQLRFLVMGSLAIAWSAGWLATRAWEIRPVRIGGAWAGLAATAAIAAVFPVSRLSLPDPIERLAPHADALDLADAFRTEFRDPSADTDRFDVPPPWGVIAPWAIGHLLLYRGGVAGVASPFGMAPWHIEGVRRVFRFNLIESDPEAAAYCRRLRVRYVVTTNPLEAALRETRVLGIPMDRYMATKPAPGGGLAMWITPAFPRTAAFRLHLLDGSASDAAGLAAAAMPSFRLVWESAGRIDERLVTDTLPFPRPAFYKVFERVEGARVEGSCAAGAPVRLNTRVRTNRGRIFDWHVEAPCAASGRYALRAPYAATYRAGQGPREIEVDVDDAQARGGARVAADLGGAGR